MTATLKTTILQEPNSSVVNLQLGTAGQVGVGGANYGTSGQVLTSGGANAAPSWSSIPVQVTETVFESSGTYTPNANGQYYEVVCIGGGASGGSINAGASTARGNSGPGAGGAVVGFTKAQMGNAAITVTVGSGGAYQTNLTPAAGGATSFGNYITANGGPASNTNVGTVTVNTGTANVSASGNVAVNSNNVSRKSGSSIRPYSAPTSAFGGSVASGGGMDGLAGMFPGSGGTGGIAQGTANVSQTGNGGEGGPGIVIVREYF